MAEQISFTDNADDMTVITRGPTISMISAAVAGGEIWLIQLFLRQCADQPRTVSVGGR
jgi:hypothetical protein